MRAAFSSISLAVCSDSKHFKSISGFYTRLSQKLSDYPGFVCSPCPGRLSNGTCTGRGVCEDDVAVKRRAAREREISPLQLAFLKGKGTCSCSEHFNGSTCELGQCPPGSQYAEHAIIAHCTLCHSATGFRGRHAWLMAEASPGSTSRCGITR